jgi:23S rRNA pseudoU1915 N3-methylase RlmH
VGRARGPLAEAAVEYEARIARLASFDVHVVKDEPLDRGTADEIRRREGERLLAALDGWTVVALDRTGRAIDSEGLAGLVGRLEEELPQPRPS